MPSAQDTIFNEAMSAVQAGDRARARDLLTRLLKTGQDNPEYWVWMSAVVDTTKERAYCLNQALKLDPQNKAARRGLTIMGQMTPDESLILPARLQKRNWQAKLMPADNELASGMAPALQMGLMGGGLVVVVGLVLFFVFGNFFKPPQQRATQSAARRWPTETPLSTQMVVAAARTQAAVTTGEPTPLWLMLDATYTPTPLYVNTPHPASVSEAFKYGLRGYTRGEWASVENFMKQVLTVEPNAVDARYFMADAYRMQGKLTQALNAFNDIIKAYPNFAPSYLGRARTRLAADKNAVAAARADLETALKKDPNMGEVYLELIALLIAEKNDKEAKPLLVQAARVLPDSPMIFLYRAEINMRAGEYELALADAQRANQLDMTLLPAYLFMGEALHMTGDLDGSRQALDIYTSYVKDDPRAWLWIGMAHESAGETEKAHQAFDEALRLNSRLFEALLHRAQILLVEKDGDGALDDFQAAIRLDSQSFEASIGVGKALMLLEYEGDAYVQFERSQVLAKQDQQKAELMYWRALSLEALDENVAALREWNKLLALPADSLSEEWTVYASQRVQALASATPTAKPSTATPTVRPSETRVPTRTPIPSGTPKLSGTPKPTRTQ